MLKYLRTRLSHMLVLITTLLTCQETTSLGSGLEEMLVQSKPLDTGIQKY